MDWVVIVLLAAGLFVFFVGTVGILRLPDFYTRMHAAGKCDTLGAILTLSAIALFNLESFTLANVLVSLKILAIVAFVFVASPTATHVLTKGALIVGIEPWRKEKKNP